ncbi:tRNA 2-thiouridine(34) synthase MnmA [Thalassospira sp. UBA6510]|uniref:tRNA 2-thiouridine(34) synthase MnmA n=2 Tax=unclassified Thalassospira TaxID=2648997 RepID=UPI0025D25E83|nr:tRNA 2-thiouridine(34) synthase MnmA [Thalassospira sp. UBA6510]|tara:strand:- start:7958 stop:9103 length:1146 start_codon:yes stop_codon:yes gene_type:complete
MNSLGFDKAPEDTRVVVAMSGGVDSSAVAALLKSEGYDVVGITLQLYDMGANAPTRAKSCCAGRDIYDARKVAEDIDIPYYVLDYESRFREEVIDDFADSYMRGETPIPCVKCNQTVKFRDLLETSYDLGADCMATGHYVQRKLGKNGRAELHRAADPNRDQSYFLFTTTQEQLDFLRFPLGHLMSKAETRALAAKYGLEVADKPDSQDICFVPDGKYARLVEKLRPEAGEPGEIVDLDGNVLGDHRGLIHYTVGQRRGLNIGGTAEPLYVVKLSPEKRQVIVGPKAALAKKLVYVRELNWLDGDQIDENGVEVEVKLRSAMQPTTATIFPEAAGEARIELHDAQFGIAPGQAGVFYQGERVLGGGWITREELIGNTASAA